MYSTEILRTRSVRLAIAAIAALLLFAALGLVQSRVALAAPANDNFANAQVISGSPVSVNGTNVGATSEPSEPSGGERTVWYRWTAPATGTVTLDTCNSNFDTALDVYTGSFLTSLNFIDGDSDSCSDTSPNSLGSMVTFDATSGVTYQIQVDNDFCCSEPGGNFTLNLNAIFAPANDNFANAQVISGTLTSVGGRNTGASTESGEPSGGERTVWYRWTAPVSGRTTLNACNSNFDTALDVYTGTTLSSLDFIDGDSDSCPDTSPNSLGSMVTFDAKAGITYRIQVDNDFCCSEPGGNFTLGLRLVDNVRPTVKSVSPANQATNVSPSTNVTATFSESMKKSTLTTSTVKVVKRGTTTKVAATVSCTNTTCKTVVLNPKANLARATTYTATITTAAKDQAGNSLARSKVWSFTVKR